MRELTYVNSDDWSGLYIDGVLYTQTHNVPVYEVFEALAEIGSDDVDPHYVWVKDDWMYEQGHLPEKFSEIPESAFA